MLDPQQSAPGLSDPSDGQVMPKIYNITKSNFSGKQQIFVLLRFLRISLNASNTRSNYKKIPIFLTYRNFCLLFKQR